MYKFFIKRFFDLIFSFLLLMILFPLLLIISTLVLLKLGRPVLFTQQRPGRNEKIFKIYKFRSMLNRNDINGDPLPDEKRITKFGNFLRKSSLDELPELYNVLAGDMSFIGPRPLIIRYLPYYTEIENKRHLVRPGITGLAQVSGRNFLDWNKRFEYDVYYVEHITLTLDLKIIAKTIVTTIKRENIELFAIPDLDVIRRIRE